MDLPNYRPEWEELTFEKLTVGKIYAGLLIAENWKAYKANKTIKMKPTLFKKLIGTCAMKSTPDAQQSKEIFDLATHINESQQHSSVKPTVLMSDQKFPLHMNFPVQQISHNNNEADTAFETVGNTKLRDVKLLESGQMAVPSNVVHTTLDTEEPLFADCLKIDEGHSSTDNLDCSVEFRPKAKIDPIQTMTERQSAFSCISTINPCPASLQQRPQLISNIHSSNPRFTNTTGIETVRVADMTNSAGFAKSIGSIFSSINKSVSSAFTTLMTGADQPGYQQGNSNTTTHPNMSSFDSQHSNFNKQPQSGVLARFQSLSPLPIHKPLSQAPVGSSAMTSSTPHVPNLALAYAQSSPSDIQDPSLQFSKKGMESVNKISSAADLLQSSKDASIQRVQPLPCHPSASVCPSQLSKQLATQKNFPLGHFHSTDLTEDCFKNEKMWDSSISSAFDDNQTKGAALGKHQEYFGSANLSGRSRTPSPSPSPPNLDSTRKFVARKLPTTPARKPSQLNLIPRQAAEDHMPHILPSPSLPPDSIAVNFPALDPSPSHCPIHSDRINSAPHFDLPRCASSHQLEHSPDSLKMNRVEHFQSQTQISSPPETHRGRHSRFAPQRFQSSEINLRGNAYGLEFNQSLTLPRSFKPVRIERQSPRHQLARYRSRNKTHDDSDSDEGDWC